MNPIYIHKTNLLSPYSNNINDLVNIDKINKNNQIIIEENDDSALRKYAHYSKMGLYCIEQMLKDYNEKLVDYGIVFTTGYGNNQTSQYIIDNDFPYNAITTTNYEPNSIVGTISIQKGIKGISTCMTTGNILEYSKILLDDKRTNYIILGSIEEYSPIYEKSLKQKQAFKNIILVEGVSTMIISNNSYHSIAKITQLKSISLNKCPYLFKLNENIIVNKLINLFTKLKKPDLILTTMNNSYFDNYEQKALTKVFNNIPTKSYKKYLGESLGNANLQNIILATKLIEKYKTILCLGLDMHGNYFSTIIER